MTRASLKETHTERAVAALLDLLETAETELKRPVKEGTISISKHPIALAVSAIYHLFGDHDSARTYAAKHMEILSKNVPSSNPDPSFDSIHRLLGDSHGLPQGDAVTAGALRWREALTDETLKPCDPLMFGLMQLVLKISPPLSRRREGGQLIVAILLMLRFCFRLIHCQEPSYDDTIEFAMKYLNDIAATKRLNAEELKNYVMWHANQLDTDFFVTLANMMEDAPDLFGFHYPHNSARLLERPEAGLLKTRLEEDVMEDA